MARSLGRQVEKKGKRRVARGACKERKGRGDGELGCGGRGQKENVGENSNMPRNSNGCAWNAFESLIVLRKHIFLVLPILQRRVPPFVPDCAIRFLLLPPPPPPSVRERNACRICLRRKMYFSSSHAAHDGGEKIVRVVSAVVYRVAPRRGEQWFSIAPST